MAAIAANGQFHRAGFSNQEIAVTHLHGISASPRCAATAGSIFHRTRNDDVAIGRRDALAAVDSAIAADGFHHHAGNIDVAYRIDAHTAVFFRAVAADGGHMTSDRNIISINASAAAGVYAVAADSGHITGDRNIVRPNAAAAGLVRMAAAGQRQGMAGCGISRLNGDRALRVNRIITAGDGVRSLEDHLHALVSRMLEQQGILICGRGKLHVLQDDRLNGILKYQAEGTAGRSRNRHFRIPKGL